MKSSILLAAIILLHPLRTNAQPAEQGWGKFGFLIGTWTGEGSGSPGEGTGSFSFLPELDGRILVRKNHTAYPADADKPAIVHDDLLIVYRDAPDSVEKAIYFDNEGHVIHYAIGYPAEGKIMFTSMKSSGMPFFRLTYEKLGEGSVRILFEMSRDGIVYRKYLEGTARRTG